MFFKKINAYHKGLVFKAGKYSGMLHEGVHFVKAGCKIEEYDMHKQFVAPVELNLLLQDEELKDALHVVNVKNNEIAIRLDNGLFKQVLTAGRYAFWKGITDYHFVIINLDDMNISDNIEPAILMRHEVLDYIRLYNVESHEKALLYIEGNFVKVLEPGVYKFWKNQRTVNVYKADLRRQQMEITGQEILTRDKATLRANMFIHYRITDIMKAVNDNKEVEKQLHIVMQMVLRQYVGAYTLDELLDKRSEMAEIVLEKIRSKASVLGIDVDECGIRDIILPGDVRDIMNRVLIAEKQAQAAIITRREETASTRSLLNTAKLMEENQVLMRLKEMEYVERIADKISNISLSGGGDVITQLRQVLIPTAKK